MSELGAKPPRKAGPSINRSGLNYCNLEHLFSLNTALAAAIFVLALITINGSDARVIFYGAVLAIAFATFQVSAAWTVLGLGVL